MNQSIFDGILYLIIIIPLAGSFVIYTGFHWLTRNIKGKDSNNHMFEETYRIYSQDKNYNIDEIYSGNCISPEIIKNNVDLYKLKYGDLLCYGVMKGKYFVEINYDDNNYNLRIFNNNKEYFKDIDGNIHNGYYENINRELGNGA